jgi:hypothetical protein
VDDVLDAAVAAWTARRLADGTARCLPDPPDEMPKVETPSSGTDRGRRNDGATGTVRSVRVVVWRRDQVGLASMSTTRGGHAT